MAVAYVSRLPSLVLACCALAACSDQSKIESEIRENWPKAEFTEFKSIAPNEYADAMDEWMKPFAGSKWRPTGRETVARPQFKDAKFYSIQQQTTNGYGNVVKKLRFCSILDGEVNCQVTKSLTSLEDARRGAPNR